MWTRNEGPSNASSGGRRRGGGGGGAGGDLPFPSGTHACVVEIQGLSFALSPQSLTCRPNERQTDERVDGRAGGWTTVLNAGGGGGGGGNGSSWLAGWLADIYCSLLPSSWCRPVVIILSHPSQPFIVRQAGRQTPSCRPEGVALPFSQFLLHSFLVGVIRTM